MSKIIARVIYDVRSDPSAASITLRFVMTFPHENKEQNHKIQEILNHIENDGLISINIEPEAKEAIECKDDDKWGNW